MMTEKSTEVLEEEALLTLDAKQLQQLRDTQAERARPLIEDLDRRRATSIAQAPFIVATNGKKS